MRKACTRDESDLTLGVIFFFFNAARNQMTDYSRVPRLDDIGVVSALLLGVPRHQLDHRLPYQTQIGSQADQHGGRHTFAFAQETEEDVLSPDIGVTQLQRHA